MSIVMVERPRPRLMPLLGPDGTWDRAALETWIESSSCYKWAMPDDSLAQLGLKAGDLLVTDPLVEITAGGLAGVASGECLDFCTVGLVKLDEEQDPLLVDSQGRRHYLGGVGEQLEQMILGWIPFPEFHEPTIADLDRIQMLPAVFVDPLPPGRPEPEDRRLIPLPPLMEEPPF